MQIVEMMQSFLYWRFREAMHYQISQNPEPSDKILCDNVKKSDLAPNIHSKMYCYGYVLIEFLLIDARNTTNKANPTIFIGCSVSM